jgi:hypothetical protein
MTKDSDNDRLVGVPDRAASHLTDRKFPGNTTESYRSQKPLRIIGEISGWQGHPTGMVKQVKANIARIIQQDG